MKKTIKIVVLLCLLPVVVLSMASCELLNGLLGKDEPAETTPEVTTPEETTPEVTTPEPHVHAEEPIYGYAATCTEDGLSDGVRCADCEEILVAQAVIPAVGHIETVQQGREPTCTQDGLTDGLYCWECLETFVEQDVIPATGHTEVIDAAVEPTCTETGLTEGKHCSECGEILIAQTELSENGHSYTSVVTAPTATKNGLTEYTCSGCGDSYTEEIVPVDFTLFQGDKSMLGYNGEAAFIIPAVFENKGKWYRVVALDEYALYQCSSLSSVSIPSTVTKIPHLNLYGCKYLSEITIDEENPVYYSEGNCIIERATKTLIQGCQGSVIPEGITAIGYKAFSSTQISTVTIPNGVERIDAGAFSQCASLHSVSIPNSVIVIGESAFYGCQELKNIVIPNSVTSILKEAFRGCTNLKSVTIGSSVGSIGGLAFEGTALENLTIPASVTSIAADAFAYCSSSLQSITVDADNPNYYSDGNCLIELVSQTLIVGCVNSQIPQDIRIIADSAFYNCTGMTGIEIPNSVQEFGWGAFRNCKGLVRIVYRGTMAQWEAISKGKNWDQGTGDYTVYCYDGEIAK